MPKKTAAKKTSRADFVRSQPATMPAADVVAKAAAAGVKLSKDNVYRTRMLDNRAKRSGGSAAPGRTRSRSRGKRPAGQHTEHVRALRSVVLHVGIDRARELMDDVVRGLLG